MAIDLGRVPPDMVEVKMGADNHIDRFRRKARCDHLLQEIGLHLIPDRGNFEILLVADTGVDHDTLGRRVEDESVQAETGIAFRGYEFGIKPGDRQQRFGRRVGQQSRETLGNQLLDDLADLDVPDGPAPHLPSLFYLRRSRLFFFFCRRTIAEIDADQSSSRQPLHMR